MEIPNIHIVSLTEIDQSINRSIDLGYIMASLSGILSG